jgi:hypothetical protein
VRILQVGHNCRLFCQFLYCCLCCEGREKLFSSRPVASSSSYDIRIHCDVTENWMRAVSELRYKRLIATSCSCSGRVWHSCTSEGIFSEVSSEFPYFRSFLFDWPNNIRRNLKIIKVLVIKFSQSVCFFCCGISLIFINFRLIEVVINNLFIFTCIL